MGYGTLDRITPNPETASKYIDKLDITLDRIYVVLGTLGKEDIWSGEHQWVKIAADDEHLQWLPAPLFEKYEEELGYDTSFLHCAGLIGSISDGEWHPAA